MSFDSTLVAGETALAVGSQLLIAWTSTAPAGSAFQVYVDRNLAWSGTATTCRLPQPPARAWIDIGAVPLAEVDTDWSASLPAAPSVRALLTWQGGTYLDPAIRSFLVFGASSPGGPVDYSQALAEIPAYDAGVITDGYGCGGFGSGGFGFAGSTYSWTSDSLASGTWPFAVEMVNQSGVMSTAATATVTVAGPPNPPALNANGQRLTYTYDPASRVPTLNWLPSAP